MMKSLKFQINCTEKFCLQSSRKIIFAIFRKRFRRLGDRANLTYNIETPAQIPGITLSYPMIRFGSRKYFELKTHISKFVEISDFLGNNYRLRRSVLKILNWIS